MFPIRFELAAAEMLAGNRPSRADRRKQRVRDGDRTQDCEVRKEEWFDGGGGGGPASPRA